MTTSATDLRTVDGVVSYLKAQHSRIKEPLRTEFAEIEHQLSDAELVQVRAAVQLAESSGDAPAPGSTFEAMLGDAKATIAGAHA